MQTNCCSQLNNWIGLNRNYARRTRRTLFSNQSTSTLMEIYCLSTLDRRTYIFLLYIYMYVYGMYSMRITIALKRRTGVSLLLSQIWKVFLHEKKTRLSGETFWNHIASNSIKCQLNEKRKWNEKLRHLPMLYEVHTPFSTPSPTYTTTYLFVTLLVFVYAAPRILFEFILLRKTFERI